MINVHPKSFFGDTYILDSEGRTILDMMSGSGVYFLWRYGDKFWQNFREDNLNAQNFYVTDDKLEVVGKLSKITDFPNVFLVCSGSEANDAAVKLSFKYHRQKGERRDKVLYAMGCYFGRTFGAVRCSQENYHDFLPQDDVFIPFQFNSVPKIVPWERVSALILEYLPSRKLEFWDNEVIKEIVDYCKRYDVNVIVDEIKCGLGRMGKIFGYSYWKDAMEFVPDIVTCGKPLGAGFPLSAILSSSKFSDVIDYRWHSSTYGGMPFISRIASRTIDNLTLETIEEISQFGRVALDNLKNIEGIRFCGCGKYWIIFVPNADIVHKKLLNRGILTYNINKENISLLPNLWFNCDHWSEFVKNFEEVLSEVR